MNRDKVIHVRLTEKEYEGIKARADSKDMRLSEYLRAMIDIGEKKDYADRHSDNGKFTW